MKTFPTSDSPKRNRLRLKPKMLPSFPEQLQVLWKIQVIDTDFNRLLFEKKGRPALIEDLCKTIDSQLFTVQQESRLLNEIDKKLRIAEADLASEQNARKSPQRSAKLFILTSTLEDLKTTKISIEGRLLSATRDLQKTQATLLTQEALAASDETTLPGILQSLMRKRSKLLSHLSEELLASYERVRKTRGGVGIVPLRNKNCSGCNMLLPAQIHIDVRKSKFLTSCPSCQRMLFLAQVEQ